MGPRGGMGVLGLGTVLGLGMFSVWGHVLGLGTGVLGLGTRITYCAAGLQ